MRCKHKTVLHKNAVIPNAKRSGVSDLEARFGGCEFRVLTKSGVPNHLFRFASRVFGMTGLATLVKNKDYFREPDARACNISRLRMAFIRV